MQVSNETPKKEITIKGENFTVPAPYSEGHTLTEAEANVLNQTLAENLRNNFAGVVTSAKEEAEKNGTELDLGALQGQLEEYITEYEFGARRSSGPALNQTDKIAISMAREQVKKALVNAGKNVKDYSAEQITELAKAAVEKHPHFRELAKQQIDLKKQAGAELLDIAA